MSNKNSLLSQTYQTALTELLENILREFESLPVDVIKNFWNPQLCREDLLPYLATYLGVNQWDSSWDIKQKRAVCQNALLVNKKKGTLKSLKEALKSLKLNCTIVEWWENEALEKGVAEINFHENEIIYSPEQYKTIYRLVNEVKRFSLLLSLKKTSPILEDLWVGGSVLISKRIYV